MWQDDQHRAAKLHLHFDVFQALPVEATLTEGDGSERHELRITLPKRRLYVIVDKLRSDHHKNPLRQPLRIVKVQTQDVRNNGEAVVFVLVTDRLDLDADLVALVFRRMRNYTH